MGDKSKIEWTDATINPVIGCSHASPGCDHCYAERMANRLGSNPATPQYHGLTEGGKWTGETRFVESQLLKPLSWRKPRRIFVCSMSDLFHEGVQDEWICQVFAMMALARDHTFMILTKRPKRMLDFFEAIKAQGDENDVEYYASHYADKWNANKHAEALGGKWESGQFDEYGRCEAAPGYEDLDIPWPLPNVIVGATIENQEQADIRYPLIMATQAAKVFFSIEPLLGPVDFRKIPGANHIGARLPSLIIVGGEAGPGARPMHPQWARDIRDQCVAARVPFMLKSWGAWAPNCSCPRGQRGPGCKTIKRPPADRDRGIMFRCGKKHSGRELDGREWLEVPK